MADDTLIEIDTAKKVVELYHPEKPWKGLIVQWEDGRTTVGWKNNNSKEVHCCYTSERPSEELFYIIQAFYTELGDKFGYGVRHLHNPETPKAATQPHTEKVCWWRGHSEVDACQGQNGVPEL